MGCSRLATITPHGVAISMGRLFNPVPLDGGGGDIQTTQKTEQTLTPGVGRSRGGETHESRLTSRLTTHEP